MASEIKVDTIVNAGGDNDTGIDLATNDAVKIKIANAVKAEVDSSGHVKLDTVKGYTSAASVSVVGEGGSTTTNLQQGLCKSWQDLNGETFGSNDSFNVSGNTDHSDGDITHAYTNNMASANWTVGFLTSADNASNDYSMVHCGMRTANGTLSDKSTSLVSCYVKNSSHSGLDLANVGYQIFGDLA